MPRVSTPTIAAAAAADQPRLTGRLRRWVEHELPALQAPLAASAAACAADRYRKHFAAFAHGCLLLFHGLTGAPSLRQSYAAVALCHGFAVRAGLRASTARPDTPLTVSFSQYAASNTSRPPAFLAGLVSALAARVRAQGAPPGPVVPPDLRILDSTFLRVALGLAPWLPSRSPTQAGLRLHVEYTPALDLPEHVLITTTRTNDCQGFDASILQAPARLAALRGHTLVFDLGYYSHRRLLCLRRAGVHWVTRRHPQATLTVTAARPVQIPLAVGPTDRIAVQADAVVTLGSPNNRAGAVLPGLRLVTARVTPVTPTGRSGATPVAYEILTDRWDLSATDGVQVYLWRWLIELFFRWLKSHVQLPHLLGYSRQAVELTVWLALVVHLLLLLAAQALGLSSRSPHLRWQVHCLLLQFSADGAPPPPPARQLAFPGWAAGGPRGP